MKTLVTALASIALLAEPLAASAHGFGGPGGSFGGHAAAPALHSGGFRGGFAPGYHGFGERGGYGYRGGWAVGAFLPALYWDAYLTDPFDYGLAAAPYGCHWVAVNGEALLIDNATGAVVQVAPL
jgi:Ni/Co efflux regulator RcnB